MSKDTDQKITARALRPDDWQTIEELFGRKGACGGCWCMYWRVERHGQEWERRKGDRNKRDFKKLVTSGEASGWRGQGVAGMLLQEAVKIAKKGGAKMVEGYPVNTKTGQKLPAAFAWTGVAALYRRAEFKKLRLKDANRDVFQLKLKP